MGKEILLVVTLASALQIQPGVESVRAERSRGERHGARYRKTRDYRSLKALVKRLKIGMPRGTVVSILGEPDYCPIDGQCYYSSDRRNAAGVTLGLVVEYRRTEYRDDGIHTTVTGRLESFGLLPIGE